MNKLKKLYMFVVNNMVAIVTFMGAALVAGSGIAGKGHPGQVQQGGGEDGQNLPDVAGE